MRLDQATYLVTQEVRRARECHDPMQSIHEGYAVILEEVDELWDEVKKNPKKRDAEAMKTEVVQVAAMALRFLTDLMQSSVIVPTSAQPCGCDPGAHWQCDQHRD